MPHILGSQQVREKVSKHPDRAEREKCKHWDGRQYKAPGKAFEQIDVDWYFPVHGRIHRSKT